MSYEIIILPKSEREIKRLNKKYRSFKSDLAKLVATLEEQPQQGEPPGKDCYKIRLAIKAKGKGKSGGARVVTHVRVVKETVVVLFVYDKGESESIPDDEIKNRIAEANSQIQC